MKYIVFYDGSCGFCSRTVRFLLRFNRQNSLYFASLGSEFAASFFQENMKGKLPENTLIFYDKGSFFSKSEAIFKILHHLPWYWQVFQVMQVLPKKWCDQIYDRIARRREHFLATNCPLPDPRYTERFLDN